MLAKPCTFTAAATMLIGSVSSSSSSSSSGASSDVHSLHTISENGENDVGLGNWKPRGYTKHSFKKRAGAKWYSAEPAQDPINQYAEMHLTDRYRSLKRKNRQMSKNTSRAHANDPSRINDYKPPQKTSKQRLVYGGRKRPQKIERGQSVDTALVSQVSRRMEPQKFTRGEYDYDNATSAVEDFINSSDWEQRTEIHEQTSKLLFLESKDPLILDPKEAHSDADATTSTSEMGLTDNKCTDTSSNAPSSINSINATPTSSAHTKSRGKKRRSRSRYNPESEDILADANGGVIYTKDRLFKTDQTVYDIKTNMKLGSVQKDCYKREDGKPSFVLVHYLDHKGDYKKQMYRSDKITKRNRRKRKTDKTMRSKATEKPTGNHDSTQINETLTTLQNLLDYGKAVPEEPKKQIERKLLFPRGTKVTLKGLKITGEVIEHYYDDMKSRVKIGRTCTETGKKIMYRVDRKNVQKDALQRIIHHKGKHIVLLENGNFVGTLHKRWLSGDTTVEVMSKQEIITFSVEKVRGD